MRIAIAEAKAQFSELIRRAEAGESVELTRYGRSVAQIVPMDRPKGRPLLGAMKGEFTLPDDMFDGDEDIEEMFHRASWD